MEYPNHAYLGTRPDGDDEWRVICKCGYRTEPAKTKSTVMRRFIDHKEKGIARDEKRAARERSARGKKAYAARRRAERAAQREEVKS